MNNRSKLFADHFYNWQIVSEDINKSSSFTYRSALSHLQKTNLNPKSGVSFGGVNRIYNFYNKLIPIKEIRKFLSKDNSYTLHTKSFKKRYNPSFIRYKGQQMQADLIDVTNLSQKNKDIKFLLTIICSFTKKAWIFPIRIKSRMLFLKHSKSFLKTLIRFQEVY